MVSHLSLHEAPRRWADDEDVLLLLLPPFLFVSQRSQEEARPGLELPHDDAGLPGFLSFLCASHIGRSRRGLNDYTMGKLVIYLKID